MDNKFRFKDVLLTVLLLVIIVMMALKMVQDDRQWENFERIQTKLDEQTRDMTALRKAIAGGIAVNPAGGESNPDDVFRRLREVRKKPDYALGDWYVSSLPTTPPKINYLTSHDVYSRVAYVKILEGLAEFDLDKVKMVPHLATGWTMADDGLSMDVDIRPNVVFSDGTPLKADDVVYTWQLFQDPEVTDGHTRAYLKEIKKVEKIDDHTVRFHFRRKFYENDLRALGLAILPKHFMSRFSKRQIRSSPALVMGTGPYRLPDPEQYKPGEDIVLERNERYWGLPGPWDRIVLRIIEDETADLIAFRNQEIDVLVPTAEQHVDMLKDEALKARTKHLVYEHVRTGYTYIGWNQERAGEKTLYADKRVRQAMTMLIDRERIAEEVFKGFASVASGPFHPMGPQHNPKIEPWAYNPARAVALLKEAGFRRDKDGRMLDPSGKLFTIKFTYSSGSDLSKKIALSMKDNFARGGVKVELDPQTWALMLKNLQERNFEAIMLGWGAGNVESDIEQMFHSRNISGGGDNRNAYRSEELDRLIDQAHVTLDRDKRMAIWQKAHAVLHEDQPYTFLFRQKVRFWYDKRIHNVQRIPVFGINNVTTWSVPIEWYVPKDLQKHGQDKPAG